MCDEAQGAPIDHQPSRDTSLPELARPDLNQSGGLDSLLQELRVLLQGVQVLTGFLIVLSFYQDFAGVDLVEKWVYLVTFACSLCCLILFSAPAAQRRLERPSYDRARFKLLATRMIVIGLVPFSLALVLATQFVVARILGGPPAVLAGAAVAALAGAAVAALAGAAVAALIGAAWWLFPLLTKHDRAH